VRGTGSMLRIAGIFRNRNVILVMALSLGLLLGQGAPWTEKAVLPALALVMTLSTMGVPGKIFFSPGKLLAPALVGMAMNYGLLGGVLLGLSRFLIDDPFLKDGFVIMAAVPPAVAVIPFSVILGGNQTLSLIATIGCYLAALFLTPLIALAFLGGTFGDPGKIISIMVELILLPLVLSRVLIRTQIAGPLEPYKGTIINWSFFLIVYTIIGLNRELFFDRPLTLVPPALLALSSTFLLGLGIEKAGRGFGINTQTITSLILLGTHKNTGLAAGLALTLFAKKTAVPATITTIFMLAYIIWLSFRRRMEP
jgi:BASS family bile acid:Na+ symporter